jgi:hypothetical protein
MEQATYGEVTCLDRYAALISLCLCCNGLQHLSELLHIHPSEQRTFAITGLATMEQRIIPSCKCEDLASRKNAFTATSVAGCLDRNLVLVHIASLKQKIPPVMVG